MGRLLRLDSSAVTAVHEAGHAVAGWSVALPLKSVTIVEDDEALGRARHGGLPARFQPDVESGWRQRRFTERAVLAMLAGPAAERRFTRRRPVGADSDYAQSVAALQRLCGSADETWAYLKLMEVRARQLVALPRVWGQIRALAARLLETPTMSGAAATRIIATAPRGMPRGWARD